MRRCGRYLAWLFLLFLLLALLGGDKLSTSSRSPGTKQETVVCKRVDRPEEKLSPELKEPGTGPKQVTVLLRDAGSKERLASWVKEKGGRVLRGTEGTGTALEVVLPAEVLSALASDPAVEWVEPTYERRFLSDRAAEVIASAPLRVPGFVLPEGLDGKGEVVGIADNGLDKGDINDLPPTFRGKVQLLRSWGGGGLADPTGHGTQLAGIVAGSGERFPGIAPGAYIYFQAIAGPDGKTPNPPADLGDLFAPAYAAGVRVELCGWGGGEARYGAAAFQIDRFCYQHPDFLPVFAAGNGGPAPGSLTAEACAKNALVVGATENPRPLFGTYDPTKVADISSRGPTQDGRLKPDLVVPGMGIVGPCSRLVTSNLPGNPLYLRGDGTSQAAAVAAGGALLVREYLEQTGYHSPPAALIKALLINGAQWLSNKPNNATGYGLLDVGGTVLALKEGTFRWAAPARGISNGEKVTFWFSVTDPTRPLKVTLCWTDPPASLGSGEVLVNDLDLVVYGPGGQRFCGNDFENRGLPDRRNNVEQVVIPQPLPGTYRIEVTARRTVSPQTFALVYGQPLAHGVVKSMEGDKLLLTDGRVLIPTKVREVVNGKLVSSPSFLPGTDVYYLPDGTVYAVVEEKVLAPARFFSLAKGAVVGSETPALQDGGYLLAEESVEAQGKPASPRDLPPGVRASFTVNPRTQEAWGVKVSWREEEGFLLSFNATEVTLMDRGTFPLASGFVVTQKSQEEELYPFDRLFGVPPTPNLLPGLKVLLRLDTQTGEVLHLEVRQRVVSGYLRSISGQEVTLADGRAFQLFPGLAWPSHLTPGQRVVGVLAPDKPELLQLRAEPALYGRVILVEGRRVYFQDQLSEVRFWELAPEADFYRDGVQVGPVAALPGTFARLLLDEQGRVKRVDLLRGETLSFEGQIEAVRESSFWVGGQSFRVSEGTMILKNGQPVLLSDLRSGEEVRVVAATLDGHYWALMVSASTSEPPPRLWVRNTGERQWEGFTSARRLYLIDGEKRVQITPDERGYFSLAAPPTARLVAVNGGVKGSRLGEAADFTPFRDLKGHWARGDVAALWAVGILGGYGDGTFRPDKPITRVEMAALLSRFYALPPAQDIPLPLDVPAWAGEAVRAALAAGYFGLYPDGKFHPSEPITRAEAALMLARGVEIKEAPLPSYRDWEEVPPEAKAAVAYFTAAGICRGREDGFFAPAAYLTRAEAAVLLYRLRFLH
ncbi:S-layer domain protein [Ammonifex degensii KC4]|uniref:S-layer domain protein n=1 Tax=Ammonifex degensii (strain DSM 10501 / KC4) TaxID=429009 RepID=C9RAI6_AMMDK|nr:S-layer domain protein [Ammonifex degensii KC4]